MKTKFYPIFSNNTVIVFFNIQQSGAIVGATRSWLK